MKLTKGSKHCIVAFENKANWQLQTSSLSSKLTVWGNIVQKFLYLSNQNFDQKCYFHGVVHLDDIWIVWIFHYRKQMEKKIFLTWFQICMMYILFV